MKKYISLLICLALVITFPAISFADNGDPSADPYAVVYNNILYTYDPAKPDMIYVEDYITDVNATAVSFSGPVKFPSGKTLNGPFCVKSIGQLEYTSVTLAPNTVEILDHAITVGPSLQQITIPASVKTIGEKALGYYYNGDANEYVKVTSFTIYGYAGTAAEKYAASNGFKFRANISGASVSNIRNKIWNSKPQTQSPVVKIGTRTLTNGTDYTLSYKNNINAGTATLTISGKGNYYGSISKSFKISNPVVPAVSISKLTRGKKKFTAIWPKASASVRKDFTGYQLQYSRDKKFKTGVTTKTITDKTATKKVIKKLKKKKVYYVRLRRYRKYCGKTFYSKWSAVKSIKTK